MEKHEEVEEERETKKRTPRLLKEGEEKKEDGTRARKFPRDGPDQRGSLPGDLTLQDDIETQESPNARRAFSRPAGGGGSPFPFLEGGRGGGVQGKWFLWV